MKITSPVFENRGSIPSKYTCDGEDVVPPLNFENVPKDTVSIAIIVDDPDALVEGAFVHWTIWNISPEINSIEEGNTPKGVEGKTDFGKIGYGGPCSPSGTHGYHFKLYALDRKIELDSSATKEDLERAMERHIIGMDEMIVNYSRQ